MEDASCGSPTSPSRRVTRRVAHQLQRSQQASRDNEASLLACMPEELAMRVVGFLLQPRPQALADAGHDEPTRRAKDVAALLCVSRRFAFDFRTAVSRVVREEVHHLWNGSELSKLPPGCKNWHHLLWLLEEKAVAVSFRWKIPDWRAFQADATNRTYGAAFSAGGFSWRLLLFPRGNTVPFLSLYLAVTSDFQQRLPPGWAKFARFALIVPNRVAPSLVKMTQHQFDSRENDWGFTQLLELTDVADASKGWVGEDGSLCVEVLVLPSSWAPHAPYVTLSWTGDTVTPIDAPRLSGTP